MTGRRGKKMLAHKVDEEEHLKKIYGGLGEVIGMETYLHGPMDAARNLKLNDFRLVTWTPQKGEMPVVERKRRGMHGISPLAKQ